MLQAFVAVAETGSFSVGAEHLHLTQPAVSKRIAALEAALNARLFDRLGRRIPLTEAGHTLLPRALRILDEIHDSQRALANLSGQVSGVLSIATSHHIGLHRLPPVLRKFTESFPQVQLDMRFMASEAACDAVVQGDVELAIVTLPSRIPHSVNSRVIWDDPLVLVSGRHHPLAGLPKLTPRDIAAHPAILPGEGTFTRDIIQRALEPLSVSPKVAFSTDYLETIKMMVSVGLGWSVLPETMVDGDLTVLALTGLTVRRSLGVAQHSGHTLSNAGRAILDIMVQAPGAQRLYDDARL
jgi:DNA-binding transcriptional LysR family regulator